MPQIIIEPLASDADLAGCIASECGASGSGVEPLITSAEAARVATFSPSRRRESLTWRAAIRRELGADVAIDYNAVGAPVVTNRNLHISVSHGAGHVAIAISNHPCGIDIESTTRNFERIAARYITPYERALSDDELLPAVIWCAKEALYKFAGREGLDFLQDIRVLSINLFAATTAPTSTLDSVGELTAQIENGEPVRLSVYRGDGFVAVAIL